MVKLKVWARVSDTEKLERVRMAITNIFPDIMLEGVAAELTLDNVKNLRSKIRAKRIGKSVAGQLIKNKSGQRTRLLLHKQAAFTGRIALVEKYMDSPMGAIVVELDWDEDFIAWFTGVEKSQLPLQNRHLGP